MKLVFVCQGGRLEVEAMLLMASLVDRLPDNVSVVVGIPTNKEFREPHEDTLKFLRNLGAEFVYFENELIKEQHKGGDLPKCLLTKNKIFLLRCFGGDERVVFIDTDHICRDFFDPNHWNSVPLGVCVCRGWFEAKIFAPRQEKIYKAAGLKMPLGRFIRHDRDGNEHIAVPTALTTIISIDGQEIERFTAQWIKFFRLIQRVCPEYQGFWHIGQAAFMPSVQKLGITWCEIEPNSLPLFHYWNLSSLLGSRYADEFERLVKKYPQEITSCIERSGDEEFTNWLKENPQ
jgi:hypothetical protein